MPQKNNWLSLFGAKRRATDRALLAAMEREIAHEQNCAPRQSAKKNPAPCVSDEERYRIARAFGRSID